MVIVFIKGWEEKAILTVLIRNETKDRILKKHIQRATKRRLSGFLCLNKKTKKILFARGREACLNSVCFFAKHGHREAQKHTLHNVV